MEPQQVENKGSYKSDPTKNIHYNISYFSNDKWFNSQMCISVLVQNKKNMHMLTINSSVKQLNKLIRSS